MAHAQAVSIFHWPLVRPALLDSLKKLSPVAMARNLEKEVDLQAIVQESLNLLEVWDGETLKPISWAASLEKTKV